MKKGLIIIVIGVLTVVSLILALLFTPLRNSSQTIVSTYVEGAFTNIGIDINGKMKTARQIASSGQYEAFGLSLNDPDGKKKIDLSGNYSNFNNKNSDGNYAGFLDLEISKRNVSGVGTDPEFSLSKSGKNSNADSNTPKIGFMSTSTTLSNSNGTSNKQDATTKNYGPGQGGTHPGLDPDVQLGNLPIGDGMVLMIIFSLFFGVLKIRKM